MFLSTSGGEVPAGLGREAGGQEWDCVEAADEASAQDNEEDEVGCVAFLEVMLQFALCSICLKRRAFVL